MDTYLVICENVCVYVWVKMALTRSVTSGQVNQDKLICGTRVSLEAFLFHCPCGRTFIFFQALYFSLYLEQGPLFPEQYPLFPNRNRKGEWRRVWLMRPFISEQERGVGEGCGCYFGPLSNPKGKGSAPWVWLAKRWERILTTMYACL